MHSVDINIAEAHAWIGQDYYHRSLIILSCIRKLHDLNTISSFHIRHLFIGLYYAVLIPREKLLLAETFHFADISMLTIGILQPRLLYEEIVEIPHPPILVVGIQVFFIYPRYWTLLHAYIEYHLTDIPELILMLIQCCHCLCQRLLRNNWESKHKKLVTFQISVVSKVVKEGFYLYQLGQFLFLLVELLDKVHFRLFVEGQVVTHQPFESGIVRILSRDVNERYHLVIWINAGIMAILVELVSASSKISVIRV